MGQIVNDVKYGQLIRHFTLWSKANGLFGRILELAETEKEIREAIIASVSGTKYYKEILKMLLNKRTITVVIKKAINRNKSPI